MNWSEPLPNLCPPSDAASAGGHIVYRITESNPPTSKDFESHRAKYPNRTFQVNECQSRSISVFNDLYAAELITKLPAFKSKANHIIKLELKDDHGVILKTSGPNHYSWWKTTSFDLISNNQ